MENITKLRKAGRSLIATVPKQLVETEHLMEGQLVKITMTRIKKSGFGSCKGIGSLTKEDKNWFKGNSE